MQDLKERRVDCFPRALQAGERAGPARVGGVKLTGGGGTRGREGGIQTACTLGAVAGGRVQACPRLLSTSAEPRAPVHTRPSSPLPAQESRAARGRLAGSGPFSSFNSEPPAEKLARAPQAAAPNPTCTGGERGRVPARRGHSRRPVFLSTSQAGLSRRVLLTRNVVTAWKRNVPTVLRFYHKRMHVLLTLKILPVSISGYLAKRRPPFSAQHCDYKGCGLSGDFQIYSPQPTRNTVL